MKYAVNEEGISALRKMCSALQEAIEAFPALISRVKSVSDSNNDTLGPHRASLDAAVEEIGHNIKQVSEPANNIIEKLEDVAKGYEGVIQTDRFKR